VIQALAIAWLKDHQFTDALPQFDRNANSWEWRTSLIALRGRYDHVQYSSEFKCFDARIMRRGASDHFPVLAVMAKQ
jgi:hypothetical protein